MAQVAKRDVCIPQDGRVVEAVCMECTNFGEEYMKTFSRSYKTFSANSKTSSANCETFSAGWRQQRKTRPSTAGRPPPRRPSCLEELAGHGPVNPLAPVGAAALVKLPRRRPSPMRVPERVPELASERVPERASSVRWSVRRRVRQSVLPARLAHAHSPGHASS